MTTVTLRKAHDFERSLNEAAKRFQFNRTTEVSIHRDETVADLVAAAQTTLRANLASAVSLVRAAHSIRSSISTANADSGINDLLSEKAALEAEEKIIGQVVNGTEQRAGRGLFRSPDYELDGASEVAVAQKQLDTLRIRAATAERPGAESVTVRVLDAAAIEGLSGDLANIQLRKKAIADELLGLNMATKVTLTADTVALLKQFKLIA